MKSVYFIYLLFSLAFARVSGQELSGYLDKADVFFSTYVVDGRIKYAELKKDPELLNSLVEKAQGVSVSKSNPKAFQAFWINTYNIFVVKGIVDHYPVKSPLDIPGFFDSIKYNVNGRSLTLNEIENNVLRGNFPNEPRFHFVLVCAGLGCPPIISKAYKPQELENQLQTQTEKSLNDPEFIRVKGNQVEVSQIFEWYQKDFTRNGKSVIGFINSFRKEILPKDGIISYYPYNWNLNDFR